MNKKKNSILNVFKELNLYDINKKNIEDENKIDFNKKSCYLKKDTIEINKIYNVNNAKSKIKIAGGYISSFYMLPYILIELQKIFINCSVEFDLLDMRIPDNYNPDFLSAIENYDIFITGLTTYTKTKKEKIEKLKTIYEDYNFSEFVQDQFFLYASKKYIKYRGMPKYIDDLKTHDLIAFNVFHSPGLKKRYHNLILKLTNNEYSKITYVNRYPQMHEAIKENKGIGICSQSMIKNDDEIIRINIFDQTGKTKKMFSIFRCLMIDKNFMENNIKISEFIYKKFKDSIDNE